MIKNIPIEQLYPHPDNPRKDLGDITELAESIKAKGVLQNLTVVPKDSTDKVEPTDDVSYTIVIGHRRHAAAKLAGVKELQCTVADMDYKEQLETMLMENMQRSDLTIMEEAQGFQLMIELGESYKSIAQKTGFSESTIRKRTNLLNLNAKEVKEGIDRGATLQDFVELEKIKDESLKEKVLKEIGTNNFNYELKRAIAKEENQEIKERLISELEKYATKIEKPKDSHRIASCYYEYNGYQGNQPSESEKAENEYFYRDYGNSIYLYKQIKGSEEDEEQKKQEEEIKKVIENDRKERIENLKEQHEIAYQLRTEFVNKVSNTAVKKNLYKIIEMILKSSAYVGLSEISLEEISDYIGIQVDMDAEEYADRVEDEVYLEKILELDKKENLLLIIAASMYDRPWEKYCDYAGRYERSNKLDIWYELLIDLGYEMSEAEKQLQDGSHALFFR